LALLAGTMIAKAIEDSPVIKYIAGLIPFFVGVLFLRTLGVSKSLPITGRDM